LKDINKLMDSGEYLTGNQPANVSVHAYRVSCQTQKC